MGIACGVDAICNVNFHASESLISRYAILLSLDLDLVRAEMNLLRAMLPDGPLSTAMETKIKEELLKGLHPNFYKLYRVALYIPAGNMREIILCHAQNSKLSERYHGPRKIFKFWLVEY